MPDSPFFEYAWNNRLVLESFLKCVTAGLDLAIPQSKKGNSKHSLKQQIIGT